MMRHRVRPGSMGDEAGQREQPARRHCLPKDAARGLLAGQRAGHNRAKAAG